MNIWIAAADNNVEKVKSFIEFGKFTPNSKDQNGYTPIHAAAEYSHLELLQFLVDQGGDVNIKDNDGDTPLHACEQVDAAKWLISHGADLNISNEEGQTPLQKAEEDSDFPALVAFLRQKSGLDQEGDLPSNVNFSVASENTPDEDLPPQVSEEERAKLADIIENGTDQDLEQYLKGIFVSRAGELTENEDSKRPKGELKDDKI